LQFLFKLAGYDFCPETFQIIQRPSKFGGVWKEVQQQKEPIGKQISKQLETSLLQNNRFTQFVHQPLCNRCGEVWSCKMAEGPQSQKNTNGVFHLSCSSCGLNKFWSTQGDDNFLDDQLNLEIFSDF